MKVLATALLAFVVWVIVTWTFDAGSLGAGAVVSIAVAWAFRRVEMGEVRYLLSPVRLFWALVYVPVLLFYIVRSNLDVAYRVIHPKLPIRPGITRARTTLASIPGRALLANSVTLRRQAGQRIRWMSVRSILRSSRGRVSRRPIACCPAR